MDSAIKSSLQEKTLKGTGSSNVNDAMNQCFSHPLFCTFLTQEMQPVALFQASRMSTLHAQQ